MRSILAFAGSNSPTSINHQLILNVVNRITDHDVDVLQPAEMEFPIFSIVREKEGIPGDVQRYYDRIRNATALIISVNENNRNVSAYFKNVIDWMSRVNRDFLEGKKILLMSTSPGKRGGAAALEYCANVFPSFGGEVVEQFSLPGFGQNFDTGTRKITHEVFELGVTEVLTSFLQQIKE